MTPTSPPVNPKANAPPAENRADARPQGDDTARYRQLFEALSEGVVVWNAKGEIIEVNPAAERMLGRSIPKNAGKTPDDFGLIYLDEAGQPLTPENLPSRRALAENRQVQQVIQIKTGGGRCLWLQITALPISYDENGTPNLVASTIADITAQHDLFETLNRKHEQLRKAVADAPSLVLVLGLDGVVRDASDTFLARIRRTRADVVGTQVTALFPGESGDTLMTVYLMRLIYSGRIDDLPLQGETAAGERLDFQVSARIDAQTLGNSALIFAVLTDVTALRMVERDLRVAVKREKAANEAKSQFVGMVSHELRTPMNALIGTLEMLRRTPLDTEQQEHVKTIGESSRNLIVLLNDLLDFSKIEAGKLEVRPEAVDIKRMLMKCVDLWRSRCSEKGIDLVFDEEGLPAAHLLLDPIRVQQIINNLLSNAIKFTKVGTVLLCVRARTLADRKLDLHISVTDNGPGIAPEEEKRLFSAFEQLEATHDLHNEGTGIGLAIARRLARLMDGDLNLAHTSAGGATFVFNVRTCLAIAETSQPAPRPAIPDAVAGRALKILAVDDNATNRKVIEALLKSAGYEVIMAECGPGAIKAAGDDRFDLILMDIFMPVMTGIEATKHIRAGGGPNVDTPIVALTANVMPEQIDSYYAAGMDGVVAKPIDMPTLFAEIMRCAAVSQNGGSQKAS